jgi:ribosomal protein S12 methylthiotransferase
MKFYVHMLGCPKNDVDGEYIAARLVDAGHEPVDDPSSADSVIVNTCGFILPAKEESINEILRLGQLKKNGNLKSLYAAGCLTQRSGDELLEGIPELDGTFGHGALDSLARAVGSNQRLERTVRIETRKLGYLSWKHRFITNDFPYAYLKISDGCDRACTYCAIPGMRGKYRSRPMESILNEAKFLAANGKKELILVSQEATLYGYDLPGRPSILALLKELEQVEEIHWIRLMYLYPAELTEDLVEYLTAENKTLSYFDLPLQHISTEILGRMRRQVDRGRIEQLLGMIRQTGPGATIRTTFMVGFPGETDAHHDELKEFVDRFQFERMGVFAFSPESDTPAEQYGDQVPEDVKLRRLDDLMNIQREIAFTRNESLIGSVQEVIIDSSGNGKGAVGRTWADCPEIDQEIYVRPGDVKVGDICRVRVDAMDGYDLIGSKVRE